MYYKPTYKPNYLSEQTFQKDFSALEETLKGVVNKGVLESFDGLKLEYEYYLAENATASVIILHGLTEFTRKYHELCKFLLDMGLNVFLYDQRGHGKSGRESADDTVVHVSSFDAYVKDLEYVIDNLVEKNCRKPIYLFSHSMGGSVAALYMQKHPEKIAKSAFCAPMLRPKMRNIPCFFMRWVLKHDAKHKGIDAPFIAAKNFDANVTLNQSSDISHARFKMNMETRISDKCFQASKITNGWLLDATLIKPRLLNRKTTEIKTQCLIFSAKNDDVVMVKPQVKFHKMLQNSTLVSIPDAKHNLLNGSEYTICDVYTALQGFFG